MVYFSSPILNSYLELLRRKENSQLIGEYDAGHTTVQLFVSSLFPKYENKWNQICTYTVEWCWRCVSVSRRWGLGGGVSLILAWQMDLSALYQHGVGLSGSVKVPKCSLVSTAPRVLLGLQDGTQLFQWELFCLRVNKGWLSQQPCVLPGHSTSWGGCRTAEELCGECLGKGLLPLLAAAGVWGRSWAEGCTSLLGLISSHGLWKVDWSFIELIYTLASAISKGNKFHI